MAEIKTPLRKLSSGETYIADEDGAFVIEDRHSHRDILRFIANDIGWDELKLLTGMDDQ